MINFNQPTFSMVGLENIKKAISEYKQINGDGFFTEECCAWLKKTTGVKKVLLTTSCTHALEMCALLLDIREGDEVIMPSYTFVSTANAFVSRGATIVFVDIRPDTMNLDETQLEQAITKKTKAIVPVHYAGVSCDMDQIMEIANCHNIYVIEDAAQAVMSGYKGRALGSIGEMGCYSFHETKNYTMGEGGGLLLRDADFIERAEIIREKGTDRSKFFRGMVDKYSWVDIGSSYLPSEMNAAYLFGQLEDAEELQEHRLEIWDLYYKLLEKLLKAGKIDLPVVPEDCSHNAHMFYIKTKDIGERTKLIGYLKEREINTVFHYVPLHSSRAGRKFGRFSGEDNSTTKESERILRLPMHNSLSPKEVMQVCDRIYQFYR